MLSAQTTDLRVNQTTPALFAKYPTPEDLAAANPE
ncbi:endonuclease III, partial [Streptomyces sp. NPDC057197]